MTEPKKTPLTADITLTPETAEFLRAVLATVTIKADDPNFDQVAAAISRARQELAP